MKNRLFGKWKIGVLFLLLLGLTACGGQKETERESDISWESLVFEYHMPLEYAEKFSIDSTAEGYTLIHIAEEGDFLVVPEGVEIPAEVPSEITILQRPLKNIYLAATSTVDYFSSMDGLDTIRFSGTAAEGWYIAAVREAMEQGRILYAGKYNAPDYEQLMAQNCGLAIESTMIYHTPEVKENLESLGIPVLVDRSSYESHPLGRTEWVKLYGVLLGKEELAEELMAEQSMQLKAIEEGEDTGKTVGFFYVSSRGYVNVRKSGDYVSKMIALAGGTYLFSDLGEEDTALSTINLQMEEFYAAARDADILIYNSTVDREWVSLESLLAECPLLADCKAVQNGDVWCTTQNMFQETMSLGEMIQEFSTVIHGENAEGLNYLYRLESEGRTE